MEMDELSSYYPAFMDKQMLYTFVARSAPKYCKMRHFCVIFKHCDFALCYLTPNEYICNAC